MTSDSYSDFLAITKELRAHGHACIESSSVSPYVPSAQVKVAYEQMRALQVPNRDVVGDAQQQIKAASYAGSTNTSDALKSDIENALTDFTNQWLSAPGAAQNSMREKMELSRIKAKANVQATLDQAYDKANDLSGGASAQERANMLSMVEGEILDGLNEISGEIGDFLDYGANELLTIPSDIPEDLSSVWAKLAEAAYETTKNEFLQQLKDNISRLFG